MTISTPGNLSTSNTATPPSPAHSGAPNTEDKHSPFAIDSLAKEMEVTAGRLASEISRDYVVNMEDSRSKVSKEKKREYGANRNEFDQFLIDPNSARFASSATADRELGSGNDVAGMLIVVTQDQGSTIAERLVVLKENLTAENGEREVRHFIKGYNDHIVNFQELTAALKYNLEPENGKEKEKAEEEKNFRSALWQLSEKSELRARRDKKESKEKLISIVPDATRLSGKEADIGIDTGHANSYGFGPKDRQGFHKFHAVYDPRKNSFVIFKNQAFGHRPPPKEEAGHQAVSPLSGPVLEQIWGIKPLSEHGIEEICRMDDETSLRISTEDGAIHELVLDSKGGRMSLVNPKPLLNSRSGEAFGIYKKGERIAADVDLYSYDGRDGGLNGTPDGFPNPMLITSTGERLMAGTFLFDRISPAGRLASTAITLARIPSLTSNIGKNRDWTFLYLNKIVNAALLGTMIFGCGELLNWLRHQKNTNSLFEEARVNVGAGVNSAGNLALAVAFMMLIREAMASAFSVAAVIVPREWQRRGNGTGTALMHGFLVPAVQEFMRHLVTYGVEDGFKVPRGGARDIATLGGAALVHSGLNIIAGRTGNMDKHPWVKAGLITAYGANDLFFRSLGGALSIRNYGQAPFFVNWAEIAVRRLITQGGEKFLIPMIQFVLNEFGIIGPKAGVYDHQVAREARLGNAISCFEHIADGLAVEVGKKSGSFAEIEEAQQTLFLFIGMLKSVKQTDERFIQALGSEEMLEAGKGEDIPLQPMGDQELRRKADAAQELASKAKASLEQSAGLRDKNDPATAGVGSARENNRTALTHRSRASASGVERELRKALGGTDSTSTRPMLSDKIKKLIGQAQSNRLQSFAEFAELPEYIEVASGIKIPYNVKREPGSAEGPFGAHRIGGPGYFNPVAELYIELGGQHPGTEIDYASRTMNDAIHAAILRGDPIVPYLDHVTNILRHEGAAGKEVKARAKQLTAELAAMDSSAPLNRNKAFMLASLTTSLLRKPIMMLPVDGEGKADEKKAQRFHITYDKVDVSMDVEGMPNQDIMIGVGEDGYYTFHYDEEGQRVAMKIEANRTGHTVGNLLHAVFRASEFSEAEQYAEAPGSPGVLRPGLAARTSVEAMLRKLQKFAGTDYLVLQKAVVENYSEVGN